MKLEVLGGMWKFYCPSCCERKEKEEVRLTIQGRVTECLGVYIAGNRRIQVAEGGSGQCSGSTEF